MKAIRTDAAVNLCRRFLLERWRWPVLRSLLYFVAKPSLHGRATRLLSLLVIGRHDSTGEHCIFGGNADDSSLSLLDF